MLSSFVSYSLFQDHLAGTWLIALANSKSGAIFLMEANTNSVLALFAIFSLRKCQEFLNDMADIATNQVLDKRNLHF